MTTGRINQVAILRRTNGPENGTEALRIDQSQGRGVCTRPTRSTSARMEQPEAERERGMHETVRKNPKLRAAHSERGLSKGDAQRRRGRTTTYPPRRRNRRPTIISKETRVQNDMYRYKPHKNVVATKQRINVPAERTLNSDTATQGNHRRNGAPMQTMTPNHPSQ